MAMKPMMMVCLLAVQLFSHCQHKNKPATMNADFTLAPCGVFYKGQSLPFGRPIEEWIKLFGNYNRRTFNSRFIWDSLGIALNNSSFTIHDKNLTEKEKREGDELYIFFLNLTTPIGQAGKLEFANGRKSYEYIINEYKEINETVSEELNKRLKKYELDDPFTNYIYPFKTYINTINFQGATVKAGMSLKEVNHERSKINGIEPLGYWDKDGDWKYERGSTTTNANGEFVEFREDINECGTAQTHWYHISLRYTEKQLEYIRITYQNKDSLQ